MSCFWRAVRNDNRFRQAALGNAFLDKKDFPNEYFYRMRAGFNEKSKMFQLITRPMRIKCFMKIMLFFQEHQS